MENEPILTFLMNEDVFIPMLMAGVGVIAIVFGTLTGMVKAVARERTRREIAAYIAEGSLSPEQGEKLMKAGRDKA
ncbi:hypothetical protein MNBD_PLANCTO03-789 [hydrothermal vent metagenome]|uniref:Uncharacterized protein n=1 Tax=hydrothermal vent metagenome TaxID=652676 RepID=A0A3B1DKT1_9ZZZZ